jgi:hypothetical protein
MFYSSGLLPLAHVKRSTDNSQDEAAYRSEVAEDAEQKTCWDDPDHHQEGDQKPNNDQNCAEPDQFKRTGITH